MAITIAGKNLYGVTLKNMHTEIKSWKLVVASNLKEIEERYGNYIDAIEIIETDISMDVIGYKLMDEKGMGPS